MRTLPCGASLAEESSCSSLRHAKRAPCWVPYRLIFDEIFACGEDSLSSRLQVNLTRPLGECELSPAALRLQKRALAALSATQKGHPVGCPCVAERERFELSVRDYRTHDFQSCALDQLSHLSMPTLVLYHISKTLSRLFFFFSKVFSIVCKTAPIAVFLGGIDIGGEM